MFQESAFVRLVAQGGLQIPRGSLKVVLPKFELCGQEVGGCRSLRHALVLDRFERVCVDVAAEQNTGSQLFHAARPFVDLRDLFRRQRLAPGRDWWNRPSVYFLYQRSWDGEHVVADGVLYSPVTFMGRIGNNRFTVLEEDYVTLRAEAQECEKKDCQGGSQTEKL